MLPVHNDRYSLSNICSLPSPPISKSAPVNLHSLRNINIIHPFWPQNILLTIIQTPTPPPPHNSSRPLLCPALIIQFIRILLSSP